MLLEAIAGMEVSAASRQSSQGVAEPTDAERLSCLQRLQMRRDWLMDSRTGLKYAPGWLIDYLYL